jgi:hypothetical protein
MKLLLNVFGYVRSGGYDISNTTNTVSSSLRSRVIIFIAFLKIMYCILSPQALVWNNFSARSSAYTIFPRICTSLHCFGVLSNLHLHGDDHKMFQCWDSLTVRCSWTPKGKVTHYIQATKTRAQKWVGELWILHYLTHVTVRVVHIWTFNSHITGSSIPPSAPWESTWDESLFIMVYAVFAS